MQLKNILLIGVGIIITATAFLLVPRDGLLDRLTGEPESAIAGSMAPGQIETIFFPLNQSSLDVPVERSGNGGALESIGDHLIIMTHEGGFFDVSGDTAERLRIDPPPNGWEAMLGFEQGHPEYNFSHHYFRYNDVKFSNNRLIVSFTQWVAVDDCYHTALAHAPLDVSEDIAETAITTDSWTIFYTTTPCLKPKLVGRAVEGHMAGGRMRLGDDGTVILAVGDYRLDGNSAAQAIAQDPAKHYGKVIEIDIASGAATIISQGHSNPQGLVLTNEGDIFLVEHGRRGGDELNHIVAGADYGWPQVSLGTRYNRTPLPGTLSYGDHDGFTPPVFSWLPSVAPSSLMQIDGFHPAWDGDLLAGSLAARELIRIRINDGRVLFNERVPLDQRIRYVHQHGEQIVLWTDSKTVIKLNASVFETNARLIEDTIAGLDVDDVSKNAIATNIDRCAECHSFGVIEGGSAPALGNIYNYAIADGPYPYSDALARINGYWTAEKLTAYLSDPQSFAPDTNMPDPQIRDPEVISGIIEVLRAVKAEVQE